MVIDGKVVVYPESDEAFKIRSQAFDEARTEQWKQRMSFLVFLLGGALLFFAGMNFACSWASSICPFFVTP